MQLITIHSTAPNSVPDGVMVTMISSNTIFITWNELSCELRHVLFLEVIILIADVEGGGQVEHRVPGNQTSAVLTGLNPATTYTIAIALSNSNGTGPYSAPINVTTLTPTSGTIRIQMYVVSFPYYTAGSWDTTVLVYSFAAGFLTLSAPVILLVTLVCVIKWR